MWILSLLNPPTLVYNMATWNCPRNNLQSFTYHNKFTDNIYFVFLLFTLYAMSLQNVVLFMYHHSFLPFVAFSNTFSFCLCLHSFICENLCRLPAALLCFTCLKFALWVLSYPSRLSFIMWTEYFNCVWLINFFSFLFSIKKQNKLPYSTIGLSIIFSIFISKTTFVSNKLFFFIFMTKLPSIHLQLVNSCFYLEIYKLRAEI